MFLSITNIYQVLELGFCVIFMVPIILGIAAVGMSVLGVAKGTEGVSNINKAKERGKRAQALYEKSVEQLDLQWQKSNELAGNYGKLQLRARQKVVGRFIEFIQRNGQKASKSDQQFLEGLEGISVQQLQEFKALVLEAQEVSKDVLKAATAGMAAGTGAVGIANTLGTVAVPQFFGLFAKQVAVAELGLPGVALWMGGGNALLGGAMLGGVAIAPALAVGGFKLASQGEKALTQAQSYEAEVNVQVAKIKTAKKFLKKVEARIREVGTLVLKLERRASKCLDDLESHDFDPIRDAAKFQQVALLVKALIEISKTPILDDQGNLNSSTIDIRAKYQKLGDS
jgi:hypothetical protein